MKNSILWKLSAAFAGLAGCLSLSFSAVAAVPAGTLEGADESSVYGWVWDSDNYNHIIPVEISIYPAGSGQTLKTDIIKADDYQDKLQESIGDGYHGFLYSVDWDQFDETEFRVTAYTAEDEPVFLGELTYNKETLSCSMNDAAPAKNTPAPVEGPVSPGSESRDRAHAQPEDQVVSLGGPKATDPATERQKEDTSPPGSKAQDTASTRQEDQDVVSAQNQKSKTADGSSQSSKKYLASWETGPGVPQPEPPKKEPEYISLGMFATTGYCNCEKCCSSGSSLTYSGTVPRANHTIYADISIFPIGTRLMINDIIYTVEDIGSSVIGNKIDIFYDTHEEAENHGVRQAEVFSVPETEEEDSDS